MNVTQKPSGPIIAAKDCFRSHNGLSALAARTALHAPFQPLPTLAASSKLVGKQVFVVRGASAPCHSFRRSRAVPAGSAGGWIAVLEATRTPGSKSVITSITD